VVLTADVVIDLLEESGVPVSWGTLAVGAAFLERVLFKSRCMDVRKGVVFTSVVAVGTYRPFGN
jgi:hypothetical protein